MTFIQLLEQNILLSDGAIGTQLQQHGLDTGECPELWNETHADIIRGIHTAYLDAGARVLTTNSFGGSPTKLAGYELRDRAYDLNRMAAECACEVAKDDAFVMGSVGPSGALVMMGDVDPKALQQDFEIQIRGLLDGGADMIIAETMSDLEEIKLVIRATRAVSTAPVIASMSYEPGARGYRTMMGVDISTAVQALEQSGADIIGANCGTGIQGAVEIVREIRLHTRHPILSEPNAGLPQLEAGRTVYKEAPEAMAQQIPDLVHAGARLVGGCCGTTPEHIRAFAQSLQTAT